MRVLSQDGAIDIPYEITAIQRFERKIYFLNKNLTGVDELIDDIEIAVYSTEDKAQIAMEMLHKVYQYTEECKIVGMETTQPGVILQFQPDDKAEDMQTYGKQEGCDSCRSICQCDNPDRNADCKKPVFSEEPWYEEFWYEEDLAGALAAADVPITRDNLNRM